MRKVSRHVATGIAALAIAACAGAASAAQITITSVVPQSGFANMTLAGTPLTDPATPYDFAGLDYASLVSIDSITITLAVTEGDTTEGALDFDQWTLGLDGINTGLKLNGFPAQGILTQTITLDNPSNSSELLAALQTDGQLVGTIIDATPGDNSISLSFQLDTSLDITGTVEPGAIPLPAAALMGPIGAGLAGMFSRRFRSRAK